MLVYSNFAVTDIKPLSFYCQSQNTRIGVYMACRGYCYWLSSADLTQ